MKKYKFFVKGMHCKACTVLIESELKELPEVDSVYASLKNLEVEISGNFGEKSPEHIAKDLTEVIKHHGYELLLEKQKHTVKWKDFLIAGPIALGFILLFIFLQKIGLVNLVNSSEVGLGTAFVIGFIASVSTCMAVVGGLVLSVSANFTKEGSKVKPQILFHVGRLISFFILGGLIGAVGSSFQFGGTGIFVLSFIVAIILLVLGINLLDVFPWAKKIQPTLPSFLGKGVHGLKKVNHALIPMLLGVATFFLPCGFTQSMQIYTLTTGSFWTGGLIMLFFALGTLPVLSFLSFGSLSIDKKNLGIFFKASGLIVIFFGILNLINSLVAAGLLNPVFNF
ncbi:MAG: sulfite exporter TauE/SafE family protein [bacterium]|nr:sulfite exporter TauE/SafE family protein [bacterium]